MPAVMGGWDPVVIEETWSMYDCIAAMKALSLKADVMSHMMGSGLKGLKGSASMPGLRRR
jgi:hypothetical protein